MSAFPFGRERRKGERGEPVPDSDPSTPPDSADPSGPCPRCGNRSNFTQLGQLPVSFGDLVTLGSTGQAERDPVDRVSSLLCNGCKQAVAVIEERWVGDTPTREGGRTGGFVSWRGVHWWPAPGAADLGEGTPEKLRDAYSEGVRALGARAPHAAAVMFRRTVEGVVRDRGGAKARAQLDNRDLPGALAIMAKDRILDRSLAEWAAEVRGLGNVGGHFDPLEEVTDEQAGDLSHLIRQLLRYLYEEPDRVRRLRESRGGSTGPR